MRAAFMLGALSHDQVVIVVWIAVAAGVILGVGAIALVAVRRWFRRGQQGLGGESSFSLDELRRLLDEGQISREEYDKLRQEVIRRELY